MTGRDQSQCCNGESHSEKICESMLPNWVICKWVMINENQPLGFAIYLDCMHFKNVVPYIIICFESESCACPRYGMILGIEVHSKFVVEFSWHDWLQGRFSPQCWRRVPLLTSLCSKCVCQLRPHFWCLEDMKKFRVISCATSYALEINVESGVLMADRFKCNRLVIERFRVRCYRCACFSNLILCSENG